MELPQIIKAIETLPALKARAGHEASEARLKWEYACQNYRYQEALTVIKQRAIHPKATIPELRALVDSDIALHNMQMDLLKIKADFKSKEVKVTDLDDQYTAAKKLAELIKKEMYAGLRNNYPLEYERGGPK